MAAVAKRAAVEVTTDGRGVESFDGRRQSFDGFRVDEDLQWFIVSSGAEMGEKGTLAGVVSVLELGGGKNGGVPNTDLYTDQQVGWRTTVVGSVERHRWLSAAWHLVGRESQGLLLACYMAPPARFRTDQGFGARDTSPTVEAIQRGAPEPQHGRHAEARTGVEAQLGQLATLAFQLTDSPAQLLQACQQPSKGKNGRTIRRALRLARDAAKEAHIEWTKAKGEAQKPRHWRERKAILPPHVRADWQGEDGS